MQKLLNLTQDTRQCNIYDFNGRKIKMTLYYSEVNAGWYITLEDGVFKLLNARLTCHYNFMNKWRRGLQWGLRILSKDNIDPYLVNDFSSGRVEMYFLTPEEVYYTTNIIFRYESELFLEYDKGLSLL